VEENNYMSKSSGEDLVATLKMHVLAAMRDLPECAPDGKGARNADIERRTGLALPLSSQNNYITWSILSALGADGAIEILLPPAAKRGRRYRLTRVAAK